jgi:hypothetical protein
VVRVREGARGARLGSGQHRGKRRRALIEAAGGDPLEIIAQIAPALPEDVRHDDRVLAGLAGALMLVAGLRYPKGPG